MALVNPQSGIKVNAYLREGAIPTNSIILPLVVVGEKSSAGSAAYDAMIENVLDSEIDSLFGADSELSHALKLKALYHPEVKLNVYVLPENAEAKATATLKIASAPTEAGSIIIKSKDDAKYIYQLNITAGQTVASIATALNGLINSSSNKLFTSSVATDTLTLTSTLSGKQGNETPFYIYSVNEMNRSVAGLTFDYTKFVGASTVPSLTNFANAITGYNAAFAGNGLFLKDVTQRQIIMDTFNINRLNNPNGVITNGEFFLSYVDSYANIQSLQNTLNGFDRPLLQYTYTKLQDIIGTGLQSARSGAPELMLSVSIVKALTSQAIVDQSTTILNAFPKNPEILRNDRLYNLNVARGGLKYVFNKAPEVNFSQTEIDVLKTFKGSVWYSDGSYAVSSEWKTGSSNAQYLYQAVFYSATILQNEVYAINKKYESEKTSVSVISKIKADIQLLVQKYKADGVEVLDNALDAKEFAQRNSVNRAKIDSGFNSYIINPLQETQTDISVYSIY